MLNFKRFLENINFQDQEFSDQNGVYKVGKIVDFASTNKNIQDIDIKLLLHNLEPSEYETGSELPGHPEFIQRAEKSSLEYPIVVIKYPDGLFIADGVHRLYKATQLNKKTIKGYVLDYKDLEQFKK